MTRASWDHESLLDREDDGYVLLDVRPIAAYNGWPSRRGARGGHVPGARPFPLAWFDELSRDEALTALREKGAVREVPLVVCGDGDEDAALAAARLDALGFADVATLAGGQMAWAVDPRRPLDRLPRWMHLVPASWLGQALTRTDRPAPVVAHVNFDNPRDYQRGHIPGAIHLDTLAIEEPDFWNRRPPAEVAAALRDHGIAQDAEVVLYGRCGNPTMDLPDPGQEAGQIAAMRVAAILLWAGVRKVRVLDGGIDAWRRAGGELTTVPARPRPVTAFGCEVPAHPEYIVDLDEARAILADPRGELVSVRSWAEHIGEVSGYHYVLPKGRIKGSVFGNCGSDAYHMQNYRNLDGTMRDYLEIAANWQEVGVTREKRIAFYCGTGWRASEAFFCAWLMGWDRAAVYDGGWYEWSDDEANPVETGLPGQMSARA